MNDITAHLHDSSEIVEKLFKKDVEFRAKRFDSVHV